MPKVSVIIPNYNHARYLQQRIESVLAQTFRDWELILLDDASTDESREIMARYENDPRVQTLFNSQNSGSPFAQWNRGVQAARGEFVWIAESDDYADERFLETLVGKLETNSNLGIAYCQSWIVDEKGEMIGRTNDYLCGGYGPDIAAMRWESDFIGDGRLELAEYLVTKNTIPNASGVLIRKEMYCRGGMANEDFKVAGDWMMWAKILLLGDIAFVSKPLNYFRVHSASTTWRGENEARKAYEEFLVTRFIATHVNVQRRLREQVCELLSSRWLYPVLSRQRLLSLRYDSLTFGVAMKLDRRFLLRFVRHAFWCTLHFGPLHKPAKRLAGVLRKN